MTKNKVTKKRQFIDAAVEILRDSNPMTVRQIYYQLVARLVAENSKLEYQRVSRALVHARKNGDIPWDWIEDRIRRPRTPSMWPDLAAFVEPRLFRLNVWPTQPAYFEVWVEKDALSGIFEDALEPYGVTLNVGRGYDGWSSLHEAAMRFDSRRVEILYFGDFDASGVDMPRSLGERLNELGADAVITICALTRADIAKHRLPANLSKTSDSRRNKFVAEHGDLSVELDALPVEVLRDRILAEVEARMDLDALARVQAAEEIERERLRELVEGGGLDRK